MEDKKKISGRRASSTKQSGAGTRQIRAKLVCRRDTGKGQWTGMKGLGIKKVVVRLQKGANQVIVGKGDYLGICSKELKIIKNMAIKVKSHRCLGGGYTDGPGNHLNQSGNEKSGFGKNIGKVQ